MATTDPISDFLTCVRNACRAKHRRVDVPASRMKVSLAELLVREHFIGHYKKVGDEKKPVLRLYLKYDEEDNSVIQGLRLHLSAKTADLTPDLKLEASLQEIDAKIHARQLADQGRDHLRA